MAPSVKTTTVPGGKIKDALTFYGACELGVFRVRKFAQSPVGGYIVDDTADNTGSICMDAPVNDEIERVYGFSVR